jgi:hypothetical protein
MVSGSKIPPLRPRHTVLHLLVVRITHWLNYPGGFWEDYGYNWFSGS